MFRTASPHQKRTKNLDQAFHTMSLALPEPIPVNIHNYLQQPTVNNNSELAPDFADVANGNSRRKNQEFQTKVADDLQLVVEAEIMSDPSDLKSDDRDSDIFPKCDRLPKLVRGTRERALSASLTKSLNDDIEQGVGGVSEKTGLLTLPNDSDIRRSSLNDQFLRRGTGRKLPHTEEEERYHARFGGKYATFDIPGNPISAQILPKQRTIAEVRPVLRPPLRKQMASMHPPEFPVESAGHPNGRLSPRISMAHLPRSHQKVLEKACPPINRQSMSSPLPPNNTYPSMDVYAPPLTAHPIMEISSDGRIFQATRGHNAGGFFAEDQRQQMQMPDSGGDAQMARHHGHAHGGGAMYAREHRLGYSCTESLPPHCGAEVSGDFSHYSDGVGRPKSTTSATSGGGSGANAYEIDSLNKFYRQVQDVFATQLDITPGGYNVNGNGLYTTSSSSGSSGGQLFITSIQDPISNPARLSTAPNRQVKSFEEATKFNPSSLHAAPMSRERQSRSFDSAACTACRNDALQRLALIREDSLARHLQLKHFYENAQVPSSQRYAREDQSGENDLQSGQDQAQYFAALKAQCKQLWSLRSTLEDTTEGDEEEKEEANKRMSLPCSGNQLGDNMDAVSYTTSFESNTEPAPDDYSGQTMGSGHYLQPPKMSSEAKRQKYKNLFARRQWELQQKLMAGNSFENSFESMETYSSESSRPDFLNFPTSFESNTGGEQTDSTVDSQGRKKGFAEQKNDSGYKSQSTEVQTQTPSAVRAHYPCLDKITQMPSMENEPIIYPHRDETPSDGTVTAIFTGSVDALNSSIPRNSVNSPTRIGDPDSESRSGISGDSFDAGNSGYSEEELSVFATLPERESPRNRRNMGEASKSFAGSYNRDFSVDSYSDALFKEFVRFDPKLESQSSGAVLSARRSRFKQSKFYSENNRLSPRMGRNSTKPSPDDSIEEESGGPHSNHQQLGSSSHSPTSLTIHNNNSSRIPVILLPDEKKAPSTY